MVPTKKRKLDNPAITIIVSVIPGLALWLFHKNRQAAAVELLLIISAGLFVWNSSLISWYPLCILYVGQMVYSAALSVWQRPDQNPEEKSPNLSLGAPLPKTLSDVKRLDEAILAALSRAIRPDNDLTTAILGLNTVSLTIPSPK